VNEQDEKQFEAELRKARPARLPEVFAARLAAAKPELEQARTREPLREPDVPLWVILRRWLVPAMALMLGALALWQLNRLPIGTRRQGEAAAPQPSLEADNVRINEELVSSFDTVAKLPTGEPVRLRFQGWMDQVVLSDRKGGLVFQQRTPRVEVVPVGFETY
jgi:hypothetical protein